MQSLLINVFFVIMALTTRECMASRVIPSELPVSCSSFSKRSIAALASRIIPASSLGQAMIGKSPFGDTR